MRRVSHAYWLIPIILAALAFGLAACGTAPNQMSQTAGSTIEIHAFDLGFKPNAVTLEKPGRYIVKLVNDGAIAHDIGGIVCRIRKFVVDQPPHMRMPQTVEHAAHAATVQVR